MSWRGMARSSTSVEPERSAISNKKGGKALERILAAEQEQMILRVPETDHGPGEKLAHEARRGAGADQPLPFEGNDLGGHHRLGRAVMNVADLEAEHVARQVKGADLAAAIGKELRDAHHARDDFVNIAGGLAFGEDLRVPAESSWALRPG